MFDFASYAASTAQTAVYPEAGQGTVRAVAYVALGLGGESAEVVEKLTDTPLVRGLLLAELGDVLWYTARLTAELGADPAQVAADAETVSFARDGLSALLVSAGRVQEVVKKALRDDDWVLTDDRRGRLVALLPQVLAAWLLVHTDVVASPACTAATNLAKLASRRERAVLTGDGDER